MLLISINGVIQTPNLDYVAANNEIKFTKAPAKGCVVEIRGPNGTLIQQQGTGFIDTFWLDDILPEDPLVALFQEVYKNKDVPAVKDILDRLQVVINLIKTEQ